MLAVVAGVAIGVAGAVGGVVEVAVAAGADLMVFVLACSLATATAPMTTTALAPITAVSILTFFCWSTLTTPSYPEKGLGILRPLLPRRPETSCVKYRAWPSIQMRPSFGPPFRLSWGRPKLREMSVWQKVSLFEGW